MRNTVQKGSTLTVPSPSNVRSGEGVVIGAIFGVASENAAAGEPVDLVTDEVFEMSKVSALAIGLGDIVYFDNTTKLINKTASGNTKIGYATEAAVNPSATVKVRLVPTV